MHIFRFATALLLALPVTVAAGTDTWIRLPGASFKSALKYEDLPVTEVAAFDLQKLPVTNAEFLAFVQAQPQWRRDKVASLFAESRYLSHWAGPNQLGATALPEQPVTSVSWFAASAYCETKGARLPTWSEWEYAAAADETEQDARMNPAWREHILGWYSRPSNTALPSVGMQAPNVYGVQDLHGLIWEWTGDYTSLLIAADNRNQGDADRMKFCGAGALSMDDRENYAVLMRVAMLSSLNGRDTTSNIGFRCAKDIE